MLVNISLSLAFILLLNHAQTQQLKALLADSAAMSNTDQVVAHLRVIEVHAKAVTLPPEVWVSLLNDKECEMSLSFAGVGTLSKTNSRGFAAPH